LEIVDLGDGEIVLQRADDDSEPLVAITFSEESRPATLAEQNDVEIETTLDAPSRVIH
jgi:hypothetical protein